MKKKWMMLLLSLTVAMMCCLTAFAGEGVYVPSPEITQTEATDTRTARKADTSPKTGDSMDMASIVLAALAFTGTAAVARKRISSYRER